MNTRGTEVTPRNVWLAMVDIVLLRPLRYGWKHDRARTIRLGTVALFWELYFLGVLLWWNR